MIFAKRVFIIAGIYGVLILVPQYFFEQMTGRHYPPPITHPEFYYGFIGVALAWQFAFLIISTDPVRYRPLMVPAVLEKLSFAIAAVTLYAVGRTAMSILVAGVVDLVLALLFAIAFVKTSR